MIGHTKEISRALAALMILLTLLTGVSWEGSRAAEEGKSLPPDERMYNAVYLYEHGDRSIIDTDEVNVTNFLSPVTVARGVATYSYDRQKEFEVGENTLMSIDYEVPVYDADPESDYYVAFPDVNLGSSKVGSYDFDLAYNNDRGELIKGYRFKDKIAYIPKDVIDDPGNRHDLISDTPVAMQLNYYFRSDESDADTMFSKDIPVEIVKGTGPVRRTVNVSNVFADNSVSFEIGDHDKSEVSVLLNGSMLPVSRDVFDIKDGILTIYSSPTVIGSVNVVVRNKSIIRKIADGLTEEAVGAAVSPDDMAYYKTAKGKEVMITSNINKLYVGWRGHYQAAKPIRVTPRDQSKYPSQDRISVIANLPEWKNSLKYMYGAYASGYGNYSGYWALASYTKGSDIATGSTVIKNNEYSLYDSNSSSKKTMYEWMQYWTERLEKNNGEYSPGSNSLLPNNGLSGVNNFAVPWPRSKITGDDRNLVSDKDADGYAVTAAGNPDIRFDTATKNGTAVLEEDDYFAATCAHIGSDAAEEGTFAGENDRTVYVSCLAKGSDYVVMCFSIAGISAQEAMAVYKFRVEAYGKVEVEKKSAYPGLKTLGGNGVYNLEGAKFTLYEDKNCETAAKDEDGDKVVLTIGSNNKAKSNYVGAGTYYLKETKAPGNYAPDEIVHKVEIKAGEVTSIEVTEKELYSGGIKLVKRDADTGRTEPQGNAALINTKVDVKYFGNTGGDVSGTARASWVFRTLDGSGEIALDKAHYVSGDPLPDIGSGNTVMPVGTYLITERSPEKGYLLSTGRVVVVVKEVNGVVKTEYLEQKSDILNSVKRFGVRISKMDNDLSESYHQGDATLQGAEYTITSLSDRSVVVRDVEALSGKTPLIEWSRSSGKLPAGAREANKGSAAGKIVTDENGVAETLSNDLPYGTYEIRETKASAGYKLNSSWKFTVRVYNDAGKDKVEITGTNNIDGTVTETLDFSNNMMVDLTKYKAREPVIRGGVQVIKRDKELAKSEALGGADLNDISFTIKNVSSHDVVVRKDPTKYMRDMASKEYTYDLLVDDALFIGAGTTDFYAGKIAAPVIDWQSLGSKSELFEQGLIKRVKPNEDIGRIVTHWNEEKKAYTAETLPDDLPYGRYTIRESDTNDSYQRTDREEKAFSVTQDGVIFEDGMVFDDYVYRGDLTLTKKKEVDQSRYPYTPFSITNVKTDEKHVVVTDSAGHFTTKDARTEDALIESEDSESKRKMNPFDDLLGQDLIDTSEVEKRKSDIAMGVWFGLGEFGSAAEVEPEDAPAGALPYGTYRLQELRTDKNGEDQLVDMVFDVHDKSRSAVIDLDTVTDLDKPRMLTEANAGDSNRDVSPDKEVKITDLVKLYNFDTSKEYIVIGTLVDKATGEPMTDAKGEPITAEKKFRPNGKYDEVKVEFEFDGSNMLGKETVVFEKAYMLDKIPEDGPSEEDVPYASHEDPTDDAQTVIWKKELHQPVTEKIGEPMPDPVETEKVPEKVTQRLKTLPPDEEDDDPEEPYVPVRSPRTGDAGVVLQVMILMAAISALVLILSRKKEHR